MNLFKNACLEERGSVEVLKHHILELMDDEVFKSQPTVQMNFGEMKANIMLAYRHLEDARMRLGKAIQASEGGVSIFDKPAEDEHCSI